MRTTGPHVRSARDLTTPTPWGFAYGRFGSKSDLDARSSNVCFNPTNRHHQLEERRPKVPNSRHRAVPMNRPGPPNGASSGRLHAIQLLVGIQQRRRNCEAEYLRDPLPTFNNIAASRLLSRDLLQCVEACLLLGGQAGVE